MSGASLLKILNFRQGLYSSNIVHKDTEFYITFKTKHLFLFY